MKVIDAHEWRCPWRPEASGPVAGVTGSCKEPNLHAGNITQSSAREACVPSLWAVSQLWDSFTPFPRWATFSLKWFVKCSWQNRCVPSSSRWQLGRQCRTRRQSPFVQGNELSSWSRLLTQGREVTRTKLTKAFKCQPVEFEWDLSGHGELLKMFVQGNTIQLSQASGKAVWHLLRMD